MRTTNSILRRALAGTGIAIISAGVASGVVACGGGSKTLTTVPGPTPPTGPAPPPIPNLQAELLTPSDMPAGWSVDKSPSDATSRPSCLKNLDAQLHTGEISRAEAKYQGGSNSIPHLDETLAFYGHGVATGKLAIFDQTISRCGQVTFSSGGNTFTGTIGAMSFPAVGDESYAYQMNLSTKANGLNVTIGFDVVVARKGDTAFDLALTDLGTPDLSQFRGLVTKALAKLS